VGALADKTAAAAELCAYASVGLSGGVANNVALRGALEEVAGRAGARFLGVDPPHAGDNAGMVAFSAWVDGADAARFAGSALRIDPGAYL